MYRLTLATVLLAVISAWLATGCATPPDEPPSRIACPYVATAERAAFLMQHAPTIKRGDSREQVISLLGEPDEIKQIFSSLEDIQSGKSRGYSLVYLIQRKKESGTSVERDEKLYRIHFGLDNRVIRVEREGIQ